MAEDLYITDHLVIPSDELQYSYARSSGPGGQHVNKTSTKVLLRWNIASSRAVDGGVRGRFLERYSSRVNRRGEVLLASDQFREQAANRRACNDRLREMMLAVLKPPKRRRRTKPSRAAVERRLQEKRAKSEKKQRRRRPPSSW